MFKPTEIHSITDFLRNHRAHIEALHGTGRPTLLTLNGAAAVVVQSAEAYEALLERIDALESVVALEEAQGEIDRGLGSDASEALPRLRARLGVRERVR